MKFAATFIFFVFISLQGFSQSKIDAEDTTDLIICKVELQATFPGGDAAWLKFIHANLLYPKAAKKKKIEGIVQVNFVVTKLGNVEDVEAVSGPEALRPEAVRVIKMSPKWTPENQGGCNVKSYKRQSITFKLASK